MKNKPTLSIAPYYGGKGRMAHFIADRLNYDDSDIFVTPFGGMCRVLLNKPRHYVECYNDFSSGLCALMNVLSDPEKADKLIHRLYNETEHSQEEFDKQKEIFDNAETDLEQQEREKLRRLLIDNEIVSHASASNFLDIFAGLAEEKENERVLKLLTDIDVLNSVSNQVDFIDTTTTLIVERDKTQDKQKLSELLLYKGVVDIDSAKEFLESCSNKADKQVQEKPSKAIKEAFITLNSKLKTDIEFCEIFEDIYYRWMQLYELKERQGFIKRSADMGEYVSEMDLAIATYVVFQQSRDGMGRVWSKEKFKTTDQYLKRVLNLYECAERLEGVEVFQIDAIDFFRQFKFVDVNLPDEEIDPNFLIMNEWINNPRVMMYCDPSYISPDDEKELLQGIDIHNVDSLSDAIREKYNGKKMPKNLGKIYARSFGYDEQENFLRCIQNAKCRILVSNYDLELYNKYLNESTGWRREEFITSTGVGGKVDNTRIEVIWYNY